MMETNSDKIVYRKRPSSQTVITGSGEESCPPNRKIQKMDLKEKQKILQKAAEESKRSFHLRPYHQSWSSPTPPLLSAYVKQQQKVIQPQSIPYQLSMTTPPSLGNNLIGTVPIRGADNMSTGQSYQRPLSFPVTTARQQESEDEDEIVKAPPIENTSEGDKIGYSHQYPRLYSPAIPSPFLYMYSRSPRSPYLLVGSPSCPIPSIGSIPSLGSSSGCSSMSEGPQEKEIPTMRVAPDEYHVGVTLPQTDHSDDESNPPSPIETSRGTENEIIDVIGGDSHQPVAPPSHHHPVISRTNNHHVLNTSFMGRPQPPPPSSQQQPCYHPIMNGYTTLPPPPTGAGGTSSYHSSTNERRSSGISVSPSSSRGSTPEPIGDTSEGRDVNYQSSGEEELFCLVPGRLSLLSATQKYRVTLDEVRRRLSGPECLNASVLGGILRRAKSKNGGHHLRQRLEEQGLSLPAGRRKQTELFLLTSLVEGEALHLADDFKRLCDNFFPHNELAQIIGAQHINTPHIERRISMVQAAQVLIQELQAMVNTVGGPNNLRPDDPCNPYPGLTNFSLLSHGFGNPNISTSLSVVQNYFSELLKLYEGNKGGVEFPAQNSTTPFPGGAPPSRSNYSSTAGMSGAAVPLVNQARQKCMKREKKETTQCNEKF